ncbi:[LysW]-lysine hydrolase [bacterium HR33]|nr:[LysW]-lysine hydrolase [bacterium HR33]
MTPKDSDREAIELLRQLVAIPSPSGKEAEASQFLAGWMDRHGLDARVDEAGNAIGCKGDGPSEVLLLGHIDTFPGEIPVRIEGDWLYGRGSVDAKGPLCAFAVAAARAAVPEGWRVTVVGAVEEETATSRGARHIVSTMAGPPAYCVIGEPSGWDRITLGYRGRLVVNVALRAPHSHSAGPHPSPAELGVRLWDAVRAYCDEWNRARARGDSVFNRLSASLRSFVTSDDGPYGVVRMGIGFRLPLGAEAGDIARDLRSLLAESASGAALEVTELGSEVAYKAGKSNRLVSSFLSAIRSAGGAPRFVLKSGTSDMNVVGPAWPEVPMVAYGPGDSSLDHTPDERQSLSEYLKSISVLEAALRNLWGDQGRAGAL